MKVYISGPMTGIENDNYPAFFDMAEHLCVLGFEPINPAAQVQRITWDQYMRQDIKLLMDADMMVMLPGWELSKGAIIEKNVAESINIPIAYARLIGNDYLLHCAPVEVAA